MERLCPHKVDYFQATGDIFLSFQRGDAVVVLSQFGPPTVSSYTIDVPVGHAPDTHICDTIHSGDGDPFCADVLPPYPLDSRGRVEMTITPGVPYVLMPLGRTQGDWY